MAKLSPAQRLLKKQQMKNLCRMNNLPYEEQESPTRGFHNSPTLHKVAREPRSFKPEHLQQLAEMRLTWSPDKSTKYSEAWDQTNPDSGKGATYVEYKYVVGYNPEVNMIEVAREQIKNFHQDAVQRFSPGTRLLSAGYVVFNFNNPEEMKLHRYSEGYNIGTSERDFLFLSEFFKDGTTQFILEEVTDEEADAHVEAGGLISET